MAHVNIGGTRNGGEKVRGDGGLEEGRRQKGRLLDEEKRNTFIQEKIWRSGEGDWLPPHPVPPRFALVKKSNILEPK